MSFTTELLRKIKQVTNVAGKKVSEITETSKLHLDLMNAQATLEELYMTLGKQVYAAKNKEDEDVTFIEETTAKIDEKLAEIETLNNKIAESKGKKICPNCNERNTETASYCSNCGYKL